MNCGLIGYPLGHSYSRQIHHALADYDYHLWELKPEELVQPEVPAEPDPEVQLSEEPARQPETLTEEEENAAFAQPEVAPVQLEPEVETAPEAPVLEEPAAPVEEPAQKDDGVTIPIQNGGDVPNVNPVQDKTEPVKLTEDGKVDPTTIAKAEDFGDWEEETGCRG